MTLSTKALSAALLGIATAFAANGAFAHHPVSAKFDAAQTMTLSGVVTRVDWRNPHVHLFVNVSDGADVVNWAIELESPVLLEKSGFGAKSVSPGDTVTVNGIAAWDGTRQVWGEKVALTSSGRQVLYVAETAPVPPNAARPTPRWPDGRPMLGAPDTLGGYWGYPTATALVQEGEEVDMNADGLLVDIDDADQVAPFQPWALGVYRHRQSRQLRDDPMFLNCKPPGGVRHLQSPLGIQLIEDRERERVFVLLGSGNHNYRIIYLDGREQTGQVGGDDDNPLYYGRSIGKWEGDTLVVDTVGFNEDFWFSNGGLPHTNSLRLVERFSRPNLDTLRYEVTVDDPGAYTRPWSASWELRWVGGAELPVHFCQDNRS